jgi:hypothetical protein
LPTATGRSPHATAQPELSVVVASVESAHTLGTALDAASASCVPLDGHEILVVDASRDASARIAREHPACDRLLTRPAGTLVPVLWADGIRASRGRWVALSTGHCVVPPAWARALVDELERGAAVAGAGLRPLPEARGLDCAVLFLRYGRYLGLTVGSPRRAPDVPGDNAAYPGDALRAFVGECDGAFWELEYHERVLAQGLEIRAVPAATAGFGHAFPLTTIVRHRVNHARHFGAHRAQAQGRARVVLPTPLVPLVLVARAARMAWPFRELRGAFLRGIPAFFVLASAWAAGEAMGAFLGPVVTKGA